MSEVLITENIFSSDAGTNATEIIGKVVEFIVSISSCIATDTCLLKELLQK